VLTFVIDMLGLPIDPSHVAASSTSHPLWLNYRGRVILLRLLSQSNRLACRPTACGFTHRPSLYRMS